MSEKTPDFMRCGDCKEYPDPTAERAKCRVDGKFVNASDNNNCNYHPGLLRPARHKGQTLAEFQERFSSADRRSILEAYWTDMGYIEKLQNELAELKRGCSDKEKRARGCGQPGPEGCGEEALCAATCHTCAMGHEENAPCQWWEGCAHWEKPLEVEEVTR